MARLTETEFHFCPFVFVYTEINWRNMDTKLLVIDAP